MNRVARRDPARRAIRSARAPRRVHPTRARVGSPLPHCRTPAPRLPAPNVSMTAPRVSSSRSRTSNHGRDLHREVLCADAPEHRVLHGMDATTASWRARARGPPRSRAGASGAARGAPRGDAVRPRRPPGRSRARVAMMRARQWRQLRSTSRSAVSTTSTPGGCKIRGGWFAGTGYHTTTSRVRGPTPREPPLLGSRRRRSPRAPASSQSDSRLSGLASTTRTLLAHHEPVPLLRLGGTKAQCACRGSRSRRTPGERVRHTPVTLRRVSAPAASPSTRRAPR